MILNGVSIKDCGKSLWQADRGGVELNEYQKVLLSFSKYFDYDSERTQFNLNSWQYDVKKCGDTISSLLAQYDNSGQIACLFAYNFLIRYCQQQKVALMDVIQNDTDIQEVMRLWDEFQSIGIDNTLNNLNQNIARIASELRKVKEIGSYPTEDYMMGDNIYEAISNIENLKENVWSYCTQLCAGPMKFNPYLNVRYSAAEAALEMESAFSDMIALYLITNHDSLNAYFSYFIRSNGNLIEITDRIDEAYAGQLKKSRNNRWLESKQFSIFPYSSLMNYYGSDYKGYPTSVEIRQRRPICIADLPHDQFQKIVLTMFLLSLKYKDVDLSDRELVYSSDFLQPNIEFAPDRDLSMLWTPENSMHSMLVTRSNLMNIVPTRDEVLSPTYGVQFDSSNSSKDWKQATFVQGSGEPYVSLYGKDFMVGLYEDYKNLPLLPIGIAGVDDFNRTDSIPEVIGSEKRIRMQAYIDQRTELAYYIRKQMYNEFKDFGCWDGLERWYQEVLRCAQRDPSLPLWNYVYKKFDECEDDMLKHNAIFPPDNRMGSLSDNVLDHIFVDRHPYRIPNYRIINNYRDPEPDCFPKDLQYVDNFSGAKATCFICVCPTTMNQIQELFGLKEIPRFLTDWRYRGHDTAGNPLLDAHDPMAKVGTPIEDKEVALRGEVHKYWNFNFAIGVNRSGLRSFKKQFPTSL